MLQFELYKSSASQDGFLSSKKIDLADNSTAILQITCRDEKLGSFIENTVIDLILTNPLTAGQDIYTHFGYLLERLNKYLKEIEKNSDFSELSIFLGLIHSDVLHFSILKNSFTYLIKGGKVINIAEGMGAKEAIPQFSYISSGAINPGDALCISNTNILDHFTKEDLSEIISLEEKKDEKSKSIVQDLIDREIPTGSTHIFFLVNKASTVVSSFPILDNK
ncbi:MAG: hypothetical protein Q8K26_00970, partial [Candidatus Gracilibacteria bacterium]|nr:hypothetical protein [Candidatus Gracilibacteria bacterium]